MSTYQSPNANQDAPVVKQIVLTLVGFAIVVALSAIVINFIV